MSTTKTLADKLKAAPISSGIMDYVLAFTQNGDILKATGQDISSIALSMRSTTQDLDNPTHPGIFVINQNTVITRPTKGYGWTYGFVINLATPTGLQLWLNYDGYIALRGKGAVGADWCPWYVMQRM